MIIFAVTVLNFLKTSWQGGVRIPLLVTSTRRELKPVKTVLNHAIDWFPTILELAQTKDGDPVLNWFLCFIFISFFGMYWSTIKRILQQILMVCHWLILFTIPKCRMKIKKSVIVLSSVFSIISKNQVSLTAVFNRRFMLFIKNYLRMENSIRCDFKRLQIL